MTIQATVDVEEVIDRNRVGKSQKAVLILCFAVLILDGIDTTMAGYLGQALIADWGITKADLGPVFTSGLVGLAAGSLIAGPLGDRFGRRNVILWSVIFFGVMSALTALSTDVTSFTLLRALTGLGLGASMPNAATMVAEYAPKLRRGVMMTFIYCGFTLGAALGGYFSSFLIELFSWHWALIGGGIVPLLFVAFAWFKLPESPKFLARTGNQHARLVAIMNKIEPGVAANDTVFTVDETSVVNQKSPVSALVSKPLRLGTAMIWTGFVAAFFTVYLMNSWLPILMGDVGFTLTQIATIGFLLQIGGTLGNIVIGYAMDRFGQHPTLVVAGVCATVMLLLIGLSGARTVEILGLMIFVLGIFTNSIATGFPVMAASFYPTRIRATGTSWATGIARFGAIGGAAVGTVMVAAGYGFEQVFVTLTVPVSLGILAVAIKGLRSRAKADPLASAPRLPSPIRDR
ncbi:MFS transporter, partial [Pseudarthrobacter sp. NPDC055928]|uniref:MFS transporter n=1 Tax=Pseudarthrobacter sp. NPDC055928 TaxID=3345661 RepID=UPI0035E24B7F